MQEENRSALERLEDMLKDLWKKRGNPHLIAAKHTEFLVEPKIFLGDKLNPEILKLLIVSYLANTSIQDSGTGNIDVSPEKLVIKSPQGNPLLVVRDKKIIRQYLSQRA
jgi:hypothetical protein